MPHAACLTLTMPLLPFTAKLRCSISEPCLIMAHSQRCLHPSVMLYHSLPVVRGSAATSTSSAGTAGTLIAERRRFAAPKAGHARRRADGHAFRTTCHVAQVQSPQASHDEDSDSLQGHTWTTSSWPESDADLDFPLDIDHARESQSSITPPADSANAQSRLQTLQESARKDRNLSVQSVQWYPGHIARAERQLKEQLKMVDVVLEVRDARIPVSTHHPQVAKWVGDKPRVLVINRQDQVSVSDRKAWADYYKKIGQRVYWTHGKQGDGVKGVRAVLDETSATINAKRTKRGLAPRPVRACVIGFPNIGKSALINRLIGRRAVASAAKPGVTRALQWVRLSGQLDLLDAPGVIPASFSDQVAAQRLAVCNDIGEAAYVDSAIAAAFIVRCKLLPKALKLMDVLRERYGVDPEEFNSETFLVKVGERLFFGDVEKAGARILKDYRNGYLGNFALELPDDIEDAAMRKAREQSEPQVASKAANGF